MEKLAIIDVSFMDGDNQTNPFEADSMGRLYTVPHITEHLSDPMPYLSTATDLCEVVTATAAMMGQADRMRFAFRFNDGRYFVTDNATHVLQETDKPHEWAGQWFSENEDSRTIDVVGGAGRLTVTYAGVIVSRDYTDKEYDAIESFDLNHTSIPYDFFALGEVDICYVGTHTLNGYEPPATFEREGDGGEWESHPPRHVVTPAAPETKRVTLWAQCITDCRVTIEVPADATETAILDYARELDGGEFEAVEGGEWVHPSMIWEAEEHHETTHTATGEDL